MKSTRIVVLLSLVSVASLATPAEAQDSPTQAASTPTAPTPTAMSATVSLDVPTHYFFRGFLQQDKGFIVQPGIEIGANLWSADASESSLVRSINLSTGTWNSVHTRNTSADASPRTWYEGDAFVSVSATFADRFTAGLTYTAYSSPAGNWRRVDEIGLQFAYDDSGLFGADMPSLNPSVSLVFETNGQLDGGTDRGIYAEIGIEPSFRIFGDDTAPIDLALPVTLGFSLGDYYQGTAGDDTLGFIDIGAVLSAPLTFVPVRFGTWQVHAGTHALFLQDNLKAVNKNDGFELIGSVGLSISF